MSWFNKKAKPNITSDEDLLQNYRNGGDMAYLAQLFEKYLPLIYGVCLKYLTNEDAAKDAVMQIFEELAEKLNNTQVTNFKSWLFVVTRNYCLMQIRAGYKFKYEDLDGMTETSFLPQPEADDREEYLQKLDLCMLTLTSTQKQCVNLFYLQEKSYREVAEITGFNMNEVKSFIQNGKRNLKICMEKYHE